jgi:riboflavin kinase/FMN adenylyltransferase
MPQNLPRMQIFRDWRGLPPEAKGASVALGNFDGVHLGHAALLRAAHGARPDLPLAVLTFEPHPREIFREDDPPFRLTLSAERARLLAALGVRVIYEIPFSHEFAQLSRDIFVEEVLHQGVGAAHLSCGPDFAFGHRRGGDTAYLAAITESLGIGLTLVPPLADGAGPFSATRVRRALQDGYPERAARLLGRYFSITGEVLHGDARGRTIGFPTANIALGRHLEPARGVYTVRAERADGTSLYGVANIGRRPTVSDTMISRLEAHFFDFDGDLYGETLNVSLIAFLREEQKFENFAALKAQILRDADAARKILKMKSEF